MEMWNLAADLGLRVVHAPKEHRSGYDPGDNTIHLRPGMPQRFTRSVLAHEIAHHLLGHRPTSLGVLRARQERAANEWAAMQLITPDAYAAAEVEHGGYQKTMAVTLNVADELLTVYQSMLLRVGNVVYIEPREGAGQYAHKIETA